MGHFDLERFKGQRWVTVAAGGMGFRLSAGKIPGLGPDRHAVGQCRLRRSPDLGAIGWDPRRWLKITAFGCHRHGLDRLYEMNRLVTREPGTGTEGGFDDRDPNTGSNEIGQNAGVIGIRRRALASRANGVGEQGVGPDLISRSSRRGILTHRDKPWALLARYEIEEWMCVPVGSAALLGIIQGFAELFPFSSLGLLVILPHLIHLSVPTHGARYLPFLVALHLGTAIALLWLFRREWVVMIRGWVLWLRGQRSHEGKMAWMIIWATIPAGLVGLALKHSIAHLFSKPLLAALFLILNGLLMLLGDRWHKRQWSSRALATMDVKTSVKIGLFQILALIPGMSRSGATITAGVGQGLSFEDAAHFSFLLATPIIFAAALVELPKLGGSSGSLLVPALLGGVIAGITAYLSARFLLGYFRMHNLFTLALVSMGVGVLGVVLIH